MAVSTYGTEGEKQFKYTLMLEEDIHVNNFFGDLVDHWIRYEGWNDSVDCVSAGELTLLKAIGKEKRSGFCRVKIIYRLSTD